MGWLRGEGRRSVVRLTLGCILGATGLVGVGVAAPGPAFASCGTNHQNVMAYDNSGSGYFGNFARIYVNKAGAINHRGGAIFRSLFLYNNAETSNVEFGWTAHNFNFSGAGPYSDFMVASATQPPSLFGREYPLHHNTYYRFRIENIGDNRIFRYYFGGQATPLGFSPTMNFNNGFAVTNSEHHQDCATLWTDMVGLQDMLSNGSWFNYSTVSCWLNTSINWYAHENISNSEITVDHTSDNWGGPGCL